MLPYPDAWIEIAIANPRGGDGNTGPKGAKHFSAFQLQEAAEYAMKRNSRGNNVYVGMALRQGETGPSGRATKKNVITAARAWADFDKAGDAANIQTFLYQRGLQAAELVVTGTVPHRRLQVFFRLTGNVTPDQLEAVNEAMKTSLGGTGDGVQNADRVMRLAGTVSWPPPRKVERGYVPEVTKLIVNADPRAFHPDELIELLTSKPEPYLAHAKKGGTGNGTGTGADTGAGSAGAADGTRKRGRTDAEISALLERTRTAGSWHIPMLKAIASMIGRGWPNNLIRLLCAPYCEGKINDPDLDDMLDRARVKWRKPDEEALEPNADPDADVKRLNTEYAVLPIGGKTRVVKFGELDEFPGRVTIVMTQTIQDFVQLNNKYRHFYVDKEGKVAGVPMGSYWVKSWKRRQYDGGMAFMPGHDGDFGNRLNLWRGFGVKAIKPDGKSGAAGCAKFLDFMRDIICNGNEEHFDYLIKREATILQKRIRTEVALGLQTKEEGCGKGFYERTMGHLLGSHAMQINNADHIIGKFNPHLETLLRLTADEALFVGDPRTSQRPVRADHRTDADDRAEGLRRLHRRQLSERDDAQQLRALHSGQRHRAAVLYSDRVGCAQGRSRILRRPAGRTRQWRLRGAALSPAARGRPHGFQRPQGAADGRAAAAARSKPAAAGRVVVRTAGDRHAEGIGPGGAASGDQQQLYPCGRDKGQIPPRRHVPAEQDIQSAGDF